MSASPPPSANDLLDAVLAVSATAVLVYQPVHDAGEALVDLALVHCSPAARLLLHLPLEATPSFQTHGGSYAPATGFEQLRAAWESSNGPAALVLQYPVNGSPVAFLATVRRAGAALVVSLTPADGPVPSPAAARLDSAPVRSPADETQFLYAVLAQAPVAVASLAGPDHVFTYLNPAYAQLLGGRPVLGRPVREALPDLNDQAFPGLLDRVYRTGEPFVGHEMRVRYDRTNTGCVEDTYFNFLYRATRDAAGRITGILLFASDVTDTVATRLRTQRLNAELQQTNQDLEARVQARTQQVLQQTRRLERLVQEAPAAIALLAGPALVFELLNARYQALFPDRALLGRPVLEALPELADTPLAEQLQRVFRTGETYEGVEAPIPFAGPDGQVATRYFDFIYQPRYAADGAIDGLVLFGFEVTERVQRRRQVQDLNDELRAANDELSAANAQLTRVNADLDTFVYTASHDLKAPITNIEGLVQALREETATGQWTAEARHMLQLMAGNVQRFQTTLGHLTEVTRLQPDTAPAAPVDVARVVADVEQDLAPLIALARPRLTVDVAACPALRVPAKTLRSVVYNLLSNALKYRHPDRAPDIQVRAWCEPHAGVVTVTDNGLGIDLQRQTELFGMFRRYHTHVEGTGIGLFMVKRMVEHVGGRVTVRSQLGEGSTFTVYFPL